jgi:hypothetical protein
MQKLQAKGRYLLKLSQIILHDITTQMAIHLVLLFQRLKGTLVTGPWYRFT